jgi:hypothetical protein
MKNLNIKYFTPVKPKGVPKCTIQKTGRLCFNKKAIEKLGLNKKVYIKLGFCEEEPKNLFLCLNFIKVKDVFQVSKLGDYYYINSKNCFDEHGIDYHKKRIIFDIEIIEKQTRLAKEIYRLKRR